MNERSPPQRPVDPDVEAKARGVVRRGRGRPKGRKDKRRRRRPIRAPPPENPDAFSIREFCRKHMISRATYNRLRAEGRGPREIKLDQKVLISKEAAADWRKRLEAETAAARTAAE